MPFRFPPISEALRDVRYGVRQIRRSSGPSAVVILSLALGIGANAAIFTVVNAVMLKNLPVEDPERLLVLQYLEPEGGWSGPLDHAQSGRGSRDAAGRPVGLSVSWPSFAYIRSQARLSNVAGFVPLGLLSRPAAMVHGQAISVDADMVTAEMLRVLGVAPIAGRGIVSDDEKPQAERVAVISHGYWNRVHGRSRDVIGSRITLNGVPVTIVGVAPPSFTGLDVGRSPDMWIQMGPRPGLTPWGVRPKGAPEQVFAASDWWWLQVVCRPKPDVPAEQARLELERVFRESLAVSAGQSLPADKLPAVVLTPASRGLNSVRSGFAKPLALLAGVAGVVLLIACANVATLLLARATVRRKEMAVRLAMGAGRRRLVRQLLAENALYAVSGAAIGLLLAHWGARLLLVLLARGSDPVPIEVRPDTMVMGFTLALSLATTVLFGLAPAFSATRLDVASDLKEKAGAARDRTAWFGGRRMLVAAQIALSLPLVVGAGLFARTLGNLTTQALGFEPEGVLLFRADPTKAGVEGDALLAALGRIQEGVTTLPGVRNVAVSAHGLISGWSNNGSITVEGSASTAGDVTARGVYNNIVGPRFFETVGIPLVLGRGVDERDGPASPRVAVVNESLARQCFPNKSPIGMRFWFGRARGDMAFEIVGVVGDAKYATLRAPAPPTVYVPYAQSHTPISTMTFHVRTAGNPASLAAGVRKVVAEIAPGVPVTDVRTQAQQMTNSLGHERMYARLLGLFAALGLGLACIGLFGTLSYSLGCRTREIGIRMALGASPRGVLGGALRDAVLITAGGMAAGGLLALAGARYVRSLLFEVTPLDGPTLAVAVTVMAAVALGAGYLPARRASRLDPLRALRED